MDEPIRVLHVLQRMEAAGVQTLLMNMYRKIDRTKVQFDFLVHYTAPQFFDEEIESLGGRIYRLSVREDYNFIKYYRELNCFFKGHPEYKVVHGHMHTLGAIYLHVAKRYSIPVRIAHSHTNATQNDSKKIIKTLMNHIYSHDATTLFACSSAAGKYMFGNRDFQVINNAIDTRCFLFDEKNRQKKRIELGIENNFVVGCVGRFELQKNQKFSIEIFEELLKKIPSAVLLLIGSGSMEAEIKEMVSLKRISTAIKFLGNRRDVAELYQAMDVFLFPSLFEGLGIVGVEAQAAGTPTVCTDTLPEEINVTPLIHRISLSNKPEAWVEKIIEASKDSLKHQSMMPYVKEAHYDIVTIAKELETFYLTSHEECLAMKGSCNE